MSQESDAHVLASMGHKVVSEIGRTALWQLVLFSALCTYWCVRSIMRNGSLIASGNWDFWAGLEIIAFAIGALIFIVAAIAKLRAMRS
jgi:hypothetical protein